jgi:hypothetical protein
VETLASIVATGAKQKEGTYEVMVQNIGLSHMPDYKLQPIHKTATVRWMLETYPPDDFDCILRKGNS